MNDKTGGPASDRELLEFAAPVAKLQVYECPRCGTGMQVDDSAKPTKPKAQGCTKPGCFPYCDCGGIDDAPVAKQVVMPERAMVVQDDSDRLDWLMHNLGGYALHAIGVLTSGNCSREEIDAAMLAASPAPGDDQ